MGSMTGDASQRKQLLRAQIELERAELMVEIAQLREAAAPGPIVRELFGGWGRGRRRAARGQRTGWLDALLGSAARSSLMRILLGSGLLRTLFGGVWRSTLAADKPPGLLRSLLSRYPLLSSAAGFVWPLLASRRGLKRLVVGGVLGLVAWQALLAWHESKSNNPQ